MNLTLLISQLIVQLISGAIGGNIVGPAALKDRSLGPIGNTIAGAIGGGVAGQIISWFTGVGILPPTSELIALIASVVLHGLGGGVYGVT